MQEEFESVHEPPRRALDRLRERLRHRPPRPPTPKSEAPAFLPNTESEAPASLDNEMPAASQEAEQREAASQEAASQEAASQDTGWNQGDGRRADNLVLYEQRIPESIRRRIEPIKGTHFHFRNPSEEAAFLEAIVANEPFRATYHAKGKRDVILTHPNGDLVGHIHLLHVNAPDIQYPEKYYVKFYLFDFKEAGTLQAVKKNILAFFRQWETPHRPPARRLPRRLPFRTHRHPNRPSNRRPNRPSHRRPNHRGYKMKIEGTRRTRKVFRR